MLTASALVPRLHLGAPLNHRGECLHENRPEVVSNQSFADTNFPGLCNRCICMWLAHHVEHLEPSPLCALPPIAAPLGAGGGDQSISSGKHVRSMNSRRPWGELRAKTSDNLSLEAKAAGFLGQAAPA